jgi:hypothetical protein
MRQLFARFHYHFLLSPDFWLLSPDSYIKIPIITISAKAPKKYFVLFLRILMIFRIALLIEKKYCVIYVSMDVVKLVHNFFQRSCHRVWIARCQTSVVNSFRYRNEPLSRLVLLTGRFESTTRPGLELVASRWSNAASLIGKTQRHLIRFPTTVISPIEFDYEPTLTKSPEPPLSFPTVE